MGPMSIADDDPSKLDPYNADVAQPSWLQMSEEEIQSHMKEGVLLYGFIHLIINIGGELANNP
jgi:hypothetical protein